MRPPPSDAWIAQAAAAIVRGDSLPPDVQRAVNKVFADLVTSKKRGGRPRKSVDSDDAELVEWHVRRGFAPTTAAKMIAMGRGQRGGTWKTILRNWKAMRRGRVQELYATSAAGFLRGVGALTSKLDLDKISALLQRESEAPESTFQCVRRYAAR
jgi:hypothetical protein